MPSKRAANITTKSLRMTKEQKERLDAISKASGIDANTIIINGMLTELYRLEREIKKNQGKQ